MNLYKPKLPHIVGLFCVWCDIQFDQKMAVFWKKKEKRKQENKKRDNQSFDHTILITVNLVLDIYPFQGVRCPYFFFKVT